MASRFLLGIVLVLVGFALSFVIIGIPILVWGAYLIYKQLAEEQRAQQARKPVEPKPVYVRPAETTIIREREITREIVKVPCKYCGTLNVLAEDRFCSGCGAPVK